MATEEKLTDEEIKITSLSALRQNWKSAKP